MLRRGAAVDLALSEVRAAAKTVREAMVKCEWNWAEVCVCVKAELCWVKVLM